jgi:DNA-binding HxlR family transcriptional regulator
MPFQDLEKQGALQIPIYLYKNKGRKVNVSELAKNKIANRETILTTLKMLRINGMIEEETDTRFPFAHLIWLTPLGIKVSAHLFFVENALQHQEQPDKDGFAIHE